MRCGGEHQFKSTYAVKMKSYFVWYTCAINFVTIFFVTVQLVIDNRSMAMEIDGTINVDTNEMNSFFPQISVANIVKYPRVLSVATLLPHNVDALACWKRWRRQWWWQGNNDIDQS